MKKLIISTMGEYRKQLNIRMIILQVLSGRITADWIDYQIVVKLEGRGCFRPMGVLFLKHKISTEYVKKVHCRGGAHHFWNCNLEPSSQGPE